MGRLRVGQVYCESYCIISINEVQKRLTYRYQGRDFRLTDVAGKVVEKMLA